MIKNLKYEIWKPLKDYEGIYEISNKWRLKSMPRTYKNHVNKSEKLKIPDINNKGYEVHDLYCDGVRSKKLTHRLVAFAFVENPNNYKIVNHKDSNILNNFDDNLEYGTQNHNMQHSAYFGNIKRNLDKETVLKILNHPDSGSNTAKLFNSDKSTVNRIRRGESYSDFTGIFYFKKYKGDNYLQKRN